MKIGVLGAGHLGKIHLKCIQQIEAYQLVGVYDTDVVQGKKVAQDYGITFFEDFDALLAAVEVVDIVTPTTTHFALAQRAIEHKKHVFIEKPLTNSVEEAEKLLELAALHQIKVQVGHVERFNPAFLALDTRTALAPMFIEAHRLATFNPRGTDVSVVLDLMIHDLDIVLHLVKSPIKSIHASGVRIVSPTPDITNARIEFENGCVANLTASRISMKQMRKIRLFQPDAYISLDFLEKNAQVIRLYDANDSNIPNADNLIPLETNAGSKLIHVHAPEIMNTNAIKMELDTFLESIVQNTTPKVSIEDGYRALKVAHEIMAKC
jgi:predicted dehydrogenase